MLLDPNACCDDVLNGSMLSSQSTGSAPFIDSSSSSLVVSSALLPRYHERFLSDGLAVVTGIAVVTTMASVSDRSSSPTYPQFQGGHPKLQVGPISSPESNPSRDSCLAVPACLYL